MKLKTLALLLVLAPLAIILLLTSTVWAEEDGITFCNQPLQDEIIVYVGEADIYYGVDFRNNWSEYRIEFEGDCFDRVWWMWDDTPIRAGDGWSGNMWTKPDTPPGRYDVVVRINRTDTSNQTEILTRNIVVDYRLAIEFREFYLTRTLFGLRMRLEIETFVEIEEFHLDMVAWEDYETSPEDFDQTNLKPGRYTFEPSVKSESGSSDSPTMIGYHVYAIFDGHYLEFDVEDPEPEIRAEANNSYLILLFGAILAIITAIVIVVLRKRWARSTDDEID